MHVHVDKEKAFIRRQQEPFPPPGLGLEAGEKQTSQSPNR
jgi:hypothetical protein